MAASYTSAIFAGQNIEAHAGPLVFNGPFPADDLDAFPAIQSFSAKHCAGVKGHVHGAYVEHGHVESISLTSLRHG